jgi:hypothetical protein
MGLSVEHPLVFVNGTNDPGRVAYTIEVAVRMQDYLI